MRQRISKRNSRRQELKWSYLKGNTEIQSSRTYYEHLISFRECFGRAHELEELLKFNELFSHSGQKDKDQRFP